MNPTATLGSACSHGATIITGSGTRTINGTPVARLGDLVSCPIQGHGINPIIVVQTQVTTDELPTAMVTATASCGAVIISGSANVLTG